VGILVDGIQLLQMEYGWILVMAVVVYQLFAPTLLNRDTALAPIVRDLPHRVEDIGEQQSELKQSINDVDETIAEVQHRQKVQMQVQRAQARANDQMDENQVDEYLVQNGVEPSAFLKSDDMDGHDNWHDVRDDNDHDTEDNT